MQYKVVGICNVKVKMFEEIVKNKGNGTCTQTWYKFDFIR